MASTYGAQPGMLVPGSTQPAAFPLLDSGSPRYDAQPGLFMPGRTLPGTGSATIYATGTETTNHGNGVTTVAVTSHTIGGMFVLRTELNSTSLTVSSVSGGGVTTWQKAAGPFHSATTHNQEFWYGQITSLGGSTITVTWSSAIGSTSVTLAAQEFGSTTANPVWGVIATGTVSQPSSVATVTYPTLTPTTANELYVGSAYESVGSQTGTTFPGYVCKDDGNGDPFIYNTAVTQASTPTSTQSPSGNYDAIAVLFTDQVTSVAVSSSDTMSGSDANGQIAVSSSDTGSGADSNGSTTATLSSSDTGAGSDAGTPNVGLSTSDTGSGADSNGTTTATLSTSDTVTGTDAVTSIKVSSSDTGSGADGNGSTTATLSTADTGSGAESASTTATLSTSDTGTGAEASSSTATLPTQTDTGTGTDSSGSVTATLSSSDTGTGSDAGTPKIGISASDTGTGSDASTPSIKVSTSDTASGADGSGSTTATLSTSDTGSGAEASSITATLSASDTMSSVEAATPTTSITQTDTGTFAETQLVSVPVSSSDTGTFVETNSTTANLTATDTSIGAENYLIAPVDSDSATAVETATVGASILDTDTVSASIESAFTQTTLSSADTGSFDDEGTGGLVDRDTASFDETATTGASIVDSDTVTATEGNGSTGLSSSDSFTGTDAISKLSIPSADTVSTVETTSTSAHVTVTDTATGVEASSISATLSAADTASAVDNQSLFDAPSEFDVATAVDLESVAAKISSSDTVTAAEGTPQVRVNAADTVASAENAMGGVSAVSSDSATAVESNGLVGLKQTDVVTSVDSAIISVSSSDTVTASETTGLNLASAETITVTEQIAKVGVKSTDVVVGDDVAVIRIFSSDTITTNEVALQAQIGIPVHSSDVAFAQDSDWKPMGLKTEGDVGSAHENAIIGVSDHDFMDPPEVAVIGIPVHESWSASDNATVHSGPPPANESINVAENATVVILTMGPNPHLLPVANPLAPIQPYYLRRTQNWAIQNERQKHLQALYLYGEWTMFILMWHIEDLNNGLVQHCARCYGTGTVAPTREQRASAAYGNVSENKCPVCFGTTFEGGYKAIIVRPAIFGDADENQQYQARGVTNPGDLDMESTPDFRVRTGDYSFRSTGDRYYLKVPDRITLRTGFATPYQRLDAIGYNHAKATIADPTSVAYEIPPTPEDLSTILNRSTSYQPIDFSAFEVIKSPLIPVAEDQG